MKYEIEPEVYEEMKRLYEEKLDSHRIAEKIQTVTDLYGDFYITTRDGKYVLKLNKTFFGYKYIFTGDTYEEVLDKAIERKSREA